MILCGAGGHARVIRDILESQDIRVSRILDDNPNLSDFDGIVVNNDIIKSLEQLLLKNNNAIDSTIILSVGNNKIRKKIAHNILQKFSNVCFGKAIAPSAIISPSVNIGTGSVVMQGSIIQAKTKIGEHCIINTGATIDHECDIADYVHISPHATLCGNVTVGEGTWIGAGATIIQGIKIGKWSMIGAGAVVTKDLPDGCLAVGCPCKPIKHL